MNGNPARMRTRPVVADDCPVPVVQDRSTTTSLICITGVRSV